MLLHSNPKKVDVLQIITTKIDSQNTYRLSNHRKSVGSKSSTLRLQYNCFSLDISKNSRLRYKLSWCKMPISKGYKKTCTG